MRLLWTAFKWIVGLALIIPLAIIALAVSMGILGALVGIAFFFLRVAIVAVLIYAVFKIGMALIRGRKPAPAFTAPKAIPPVDPYYEAAKRELDRELGHASR